MSKSRRYGRIVPDDIIRYLKNEMSDRERNALEREAQRDPFVADALEGLSVPGSGEAQRDLERLRKRLERRVGMRRSLVWIPVAASVAVILALGTLYFTVFSDRFGRMDRMIAESESVEPAKEKRAADEMAAPVPGDETEKAGAAESPAKRPVESDAVGMRRESPDEEAESSESMESRADGETATRESPAPLREISPDLVQPAALREEKTVDIPTGEAAREGAGKAERKMALVDVALEEETVEETLAVKMVPAQPVPDRLVLDETVSEEMIPGETIPDEADLDETSGEVRYVQAEGRAKSAAPAVRTIPDTIPAMPAGGMEQFKRYIENNLRFPEGDNLPAEGIVELSFYLDPQGHPRNIVVESSPDDAFSLEAMRLLREGPAWSPEFINGIPSGGKIRIPVEFRKR